MVAHAIKELLLELSDLVFAQSGQNRWVDLLNQLLLDAHARLRHLLMHLRSRLVQLINHLIDHLLILRLLLSLVRLRHSLRHLWATQQVAWIDRRHIVCEVRNLQLAVAFEVEGRRIHQRYDLANELNLIDTAIIDCVQQIANCLL